MQYAKGANGKVDDTKWKKVLTDNHTSEANVVDNIKDGLLRQAIYAKLTKNITVADAAIAAYYTKNKANYATPASRAVRHILVKDKALADKIYSQLSTQRRAVRSARDEVHDRPGLEEDRRQAGHHPEGPDRPDLRQGRVQHPRPARSRKPVKSSYGWHVIEATADTVPASQQPLDAKLKAHDPHPAAQHQEAGLRQQVVHDLPEEAREERALRGGHGSRQDDEHRGDDCASPATTTG